MRCPKTVLALLWAVPACGPSEEPFAASRMPQPLVGVPQDGYPNYQERLMLVAINRCRAAPNVEGECKDACSTDYSARPPLMHNHQGARCARFHCANCILNDGGLSHNSYCTLKTDIGTTFESSCDGSKSCACEAGSDHFTCTTSGGQGTDPFARCGRFGYGAQAEVGAAGYGDGWEAVWGWMSECAGQDGHRRILTGSYGQIGLGYYTGSTRCWSQLYFGDLAGGGSMYTLPAGVHRARSGSNYDFLVNYYDTGGGPRSLFLVLDGLCHEMALDLGTAANGTYRANLSLSSGCHRYWFLARDSAGVRKTYPEQGSWGVGSCDDYSETAPEAQCEICNQDACPADDGDAGQDAGGDDGPPDDVADTGTAADENASDGLAGDLEAGTDALPDDGANVPPLTVKGGCGCAAATGDRPLLALLLGPLVFLRRCWTAKRNRSAASGGYGPGAAAD